MRFASRVTRTAYQKPRSRDNRPKQPWQDGGVGEISRVGEAADPRLADYTRLTDVALRTRHEAEAGLFVAEGEKVVRRALEAGYHPRSFLMAPKWLDSLGDVLAATDAPIYVADEDLLEQLTGFRVHRGALAAMHRRRLPAVSELVPEMHSLVVLEDVNDHTNVGAIFRAAAALGVTGAVLSPRCADPLYRRAVKVSMGAVFSLPYARMVSWYDGLAEIRAAGFQVLALTPDPEAVALQALDPASLGRWALLVGAEGPGLSRRWLRAADLRVRIPMARGVASLNVAAATAVACYALAPNGGRRA
jgi:tRNA G18 (ribose-2'-O)-methylase SpoU